MNYTADQLARMVGAAADFGYTVADMDFDTAEDVIDLKHKRTVAEMIELMDEMIYAGRHSQEPVDVRHLPRSIRDAMGFVAQLAWAERMHALKTQEKHAKADPHYRVGGKRRARRPRGGGLLVAAKALKAAWR